MSYAAKITRDFGAAPGDGTTVDAAGESIFDFVDSEDYLLGHDGRWETVYVVVANKSSVNAASATLYRSELPPLLDEGYSQDIPAMQVRLFQVDLLPGTQLRLVARSYAGTALVDFRVVLKSTVHPTR